jgi:hypothetical protein
MVLQGAHAIFILKCVVVIGEGFSKLGVFYGVIPFHYFICFS